MERLKAALAEINMEHVYEELAGMLGQAGGPEEDY